MAHIKTFDDFKKNMILVDKGVAEENGEKLRKAIDIAISWLQYAQRTDIEQDRIHYTYSTYIPTVLRTILSRRHDVSYDDACNLLDIIISILPMLAAKIGNDEVTHKCIEQIFNANQPLYMKLARFDKPPEVSYQGQANNNLDSSSMHDPSFLDSLEIGSCIDCFRGVNRWEIAIIEKFSDVRTECEVAFADEERQWISLSDYGRFAPFGTKTGLTNPSSASTINSASAIGAEVPTVLSPPEIPLTTVPSIGDLVDARNTQGIWYQGCVMDIREEEREVKLEIAPVLSESDSSALNEKPTAMEVDGTQPANDSSSVSLPSPITTSDSPTFATGKIKVVLLRIAYVGLFESNDEWIDMTSNRLAVLNSTSKGRRGEYSLREEIFYRAWRGPSYSLDPNEHTEVAYYMDYSFSSTGFVHLVRCFYSVGGIHAIFRSLQSVNNDQALVRVDMVNALPLIRTLSHLSLVLSKSFYQQYQQEALRSVFLALRSITHNDIRSIPVEDIEGALQVFEVFFYRIFSRHQEGHIIERFYLEYLWHFLRCPFLNRRLGGLKFLQDLLKRASVKSLYPDGIQRIEISKDKISYKLQKVTYSLTTIQICEYMMKQNILDVLYFGHDTHDSLIERSGSILRHLSLADVLETNHYLGLMRTGMEKNKMILKIIPEMAMTLKDEKMSELLDYIATVDHIHVNQELVNIVGASIERYRSKLMNTSHPSRVILPWKALHEQAIQILWTWIVDDAETSDAVAECALRKLESSMEIGISHQKALDDKTFRWDMQWVRTKALMSFVFESLRTGKSIVPCIKLLGGFVYSWPMQYVHESLPDNAAPFVPRRQSVVSYLVDSVNLFGILGNCIVTVRECFASQFEGELSALKALNTNENSCVDKNVSISASMILKNTRSTYQQHLDQLLDAVHMLYRSMEKKLFPVDTILLIWQELIVEANIPEEFECGMNLIAKIPTKFSESTATSAVEGGLNSRESSTEARKPVSTLSGSFFHYDKEAYIQFFRRHLCDESNVGIFTRPFFVLKTFRCLEKWFRWINSEMGRLECNKESKVSSVLVDPAELVGVDAFLRVCFETHSESVATASVAMITSLTRSAKQSKQFRENLVAKTISMLKDVNSHISTADSKPKNLKRPLLLLDGLIDESYLLSPHRLYPHSSLFHGNKAIFKISGTSKNTKSFTGEISLRLGETVEDLFVAVAKQMNLTPNDIKIFRQGKEILPSEFRKTISQLPMSPGEKSPLVVAERPNKPTTASTATASATESDAEKPISDTLSNENHTTSTNAPNESVADSSDVPVALSIATSMETFKCFFDLLSKSQAEQIDHLWHTIGQLPTSWHMVAAWCHLDCQDVRELAFPFDDSACSYGRVGELIYILQVIEIILYPVISFQEFVNQFGMPLESLASETASSWCEKFVAKQGIQFLCKCYEWITNIMVAFNVNNAHCQGQELNGVNLPLLLLGSRVTNKLLKGFQARSLADDRKNSTAQKFLEDFLLRFHGKKVLNLFTAHFSDDLNLTLRLQQIREKIVQADGGCGMNNKPNDRMEFPTSPQLVISTQSIYWSLLLRFTAVMEMERRGKLASPTEETLSTKSLMELKRSFEGQEKRMLAASMQDLLFLWSAISISNPSLLKQPRSSTGDVSYENLFRSVAECRHQPSDGSSNAHYSKRHELDLDAHSTVSVVDWFPTAFLEFVQWTMDLSEAQALVIESIRTLIGFRPSIVGVTISQKPGGNELHDHYFVLLTKLLQVALEHHWEVNNLPAVALSILKELRDALSANPTEHEQEICNLKGNLSLFTKMCALNNQMLSCVSFEDALNTVNFLVNDVLGFASISDESSSKTKPCLSTEANSLVYEVVQAFCEQIPSLAIHVYQSFKYIHRLLEPPKDWELLPERQAKSRFGFVGLKNFGATCYMNSLLQVMFANASVRNYLLNELSIDDAHYNEEELRNNLWYQLQKIFLHLQFSEKKWFAPSDWTFAFKDETGVQPLNTMMQQDAQEFLQVLFDRCETMMAQLAKQLKEKPASAGATDEEHVSPKDRMDENEKSLPHDVLNEAYAGAFCNIMYVSPPVTAGGLASVDAIQRSIRDFGMRTQLENFVCISVDLVGPNLQSSLETFVKGETISEFTWKEDAPKCEIVKKQCLARLSDTVIFHLKRFKYNFDTFRREKINDKFEFPITLDMKPYTREGQPEFQPYHPHHHHHPHKSGENSPNLESTDTFTSPVGETVDPTGNVLSSPLSPSDILEIASRSPAYYEYELAGVVVHTGTADSGHYYAFLKHAETGQWHEFNDSEISQFDIAKLESECFGGSRKYSDYIHATQSIVETMEANPKNAYMLIYNRKNPLNVTKVISTSSHFTSTSVLLQSIYRTILAENKQHRLACRILAKDHLHFYSGILRILLHQVSSTHNDSETEDQDTNKESRKVPSLRSLWTETLQFLLKYALHTPHSTECLALATQMSQWFADDLKLLVREEPVVAVAEAVVIENEIENGLNDKENVQPDLPPIPVVSSVTAVDTSILPPLPPSRAEEHASTSNGDSEYVILPPPPPSAADLEKASSGALPPSLHAENTTALENSPAPVLFTMTPVAASSSAGVSSHLLNHLCDEGDLMAEVFFAPNVQYRQAIEKLLLDLFAHSWQLEKEAVSAWLRWQISGASADQCVLSSLGVFDRMMMAMSMPHPSALINPDVNHHSGTNQFDMDVEMANEDPELLLALKLSQEVASAPTATTNSQSMVQASSSETEINPLLTPTNVLDFPHAVVRFLIEITQDHRLQMIPNDWRKSGQFLSFLASVLRLGGRDVAQIFVRRDMIGQLLDIVLGDVSPLRGKVYFTAATGHKHLTRKRAPSSFVTGHLTKDYPKVLPMALRSIPDWSELLHSVVMMVSECLLTNEARDFYQNRRRRTAVPLSSPFHDLLMSEYDYECLTSKTLYTTLIKQARYRSYVCSLVKMLTPNNFTFSNMIMEVLWEEFSLASPEACLVLFEITESLLSVSDLDFKRRAFTLLGRGQQSIVELTASMSTQTNKTHFVLTFIRSYLTLLQRIPELCGIVAEPIDNVHLWAKWMLLHCHKMRQTVNTTSNGNSPAVTGGAFLVVYGETDSERELPWSTRAERTYEMLSLRLFEWGLEPDTWIVEALTSGSTSSAMVVDDHGTSSTADLPDGDNFTVLTARPRNINDSYTSLSHENRHSVQNTSRNSLDSTNAIDGDDEDDRKYQELPTEEHFPSLSNNVGTETSIGTDANAHKKSVTIDTQVKEIGDNDVFMLMDGMTDEELERALASGGLFQ